MLRKKSVWFFVIFFVVVGCGGQRYLWNGDGDGDGYGNEAVSVWSTTQPKGYVANDRDCNDANAAINPDADETCNGKDDDCDGEVDDELPVAWYRDSDSDGYAWFASKVAGCAEPASPGHWVREYEINTADPDCNDANATINSRATEVCDGVDNDCNGKVDEGKWYRDADGDSYGAVAMKCDGVGGVGYVTNSTDCNDANATINPSATEICDGVDNDCNDAVDEGLVTIWYRDVDGDGYGVVSARQAHGCHRPPGYAGSVGDCNDSNAAINPDATEVCDGVDNDCNGSVDSGMTERVYRDSDGDGYGEKAITVCLGATPPGYVSEGGDCNDTDVAIRSGCSE
ncbi:MAG: hypothetical protein A2233_02630 [Candidatus Kerfeldbacteria bacterium RIFOXYA2_FULL_38_24]|uniref:Uncharacterized protein n=1 Tax=Candidatus Kerfeldbacteria bacterium RIFOXYB2_FULL_38_14 TaxID=1798547 RepID=A0A1G2BC64_9BACT|nr:MAG: hypothetical protein A2233_02630 [Candidatus Kerfeldbacteria bacterium RIFOXYA2_FULL_38_24]OGY86169.1 MAG: hypothetical protein A2319_03230 [Candidatus Kerfeldbacteria bacterium RIFOXYB2_FULL_38_14]